MRTLAFASFFRSKRRRFDMFAVNDGAGSVNMIIVVGTDSACQLVQAKIWKIEDYRLCTYG